MKEVRYANSRQSGAPLPGAVKYLFVGDECFFSGIVPPEQTATTVTAAGFVIEAILERESIIDPQRVRFYDLLTQRGYPRLLKGPYEFKRLQVQYDGRRVVAVNWVDDLVCPDEILQAFEVRTS